MQSFIQSFIHNITHMASSNLARLETVVFSDLFGVPKDFIWSSSASYKPSGTCRYINTINSQTKLLLTKHDIFTISAFITRINVKYYN